VSAAVLTPGLRSPQLAEAVRAALARTPRRLPFECFYDELGSALFEAITRLPEYGLSRAGLRLLARHAGDVSDALPGALEVVELGSGSGRSTRVLLEELARSRPIVFHAVDISPAALSDCRRETEAVNGVTCVTIEASHLDGLRAAARRRRADARLLVLFLGSNLGNFERAQAEAFLCDVRRGLRPHDALLLGTDLQQSEERLLAAYDDPLGLSAAFNLNALGRLNRELDADFDLALFRHRVRWNRGARRVEMHLESLRDQTVRVRALDLTLTLARGETIWTESSHKFDLAGIRALASRTGFLCGAQWLDDEWPFAQSLLSAV
jgi:dimethylhistidine N-methyltransferase